MYYDPQYTWDDIALAVGYDEGEIELWQRYYPIAWTYGQSEDVAQLTPRDRVIMMMTDDELRRACGRRAITTVYHAIDQAHQSGDIDTTLSAVVAAGRLIKAVRDDVTSIDPSDELPHPETVTSISRMPVDVVQRKLRQIIDAN